MRDLSPLIPNFSVQRRSAVDILQRLTVTAMLRYLAVAHFGRGRGEWSDGEHPAFWQEVVDREVASRDRELTGLLKRLSTSGDDATEQAELASLILEIGSAILQRLYPEAKLS